MSVNEVNHLLDERLAKSPLERLDHMHQFHRSMIADIVDFVGCRATRWIVTLPARIGDRNVIDHPAYAIDNVVDIGEIATHTSFVEYLDR